MALPAWLSTEDLLKFRTRFCERFLVQGECSFGEKCQYSHNLLWRRRSPQKFSYMPLICPDVVTWIGADNRRHVSINCRSGKNCNHAHSREEILYHPSVYKTVMCDTWNCARYYCPFAHSLEELVSKPPNVPDSEELRFRQLNMEDFWEDNDFDLVCYSAGNISTSPLVGPNASPTMGSMEPCSIPELFSLQMRRVINLGGPSMGACSPSEGNRNRMLTMTTNLESFRIGVSCLQSAVGVLSNPDDPGWVTITQGLRVELVVRANSVLTNSELCLATARAPWENAAAANNVANNRRGQQQATMVAKVIVFEQNADYTGLMNQLQTIARSEHKNILPIKKVHVAKLGNGTSVLVVAYERCSTSLFATILEGYNRSSLRSAAGSANSSTVPRGLAGRMNPVPLGLVGTVFTPTSAAVGKINELLTAVQRFHSLGMVHGRICPSNIFVDSDAQLKLGDCDSRIALNSTAPLPDSVSSWLVPESSGWLTKRGDVFAAGLSIFFALTGQHAFGTFGGEGEQERRAASGAANGESGGPLFQEPVAEVLSNMSRLDFVNQHLLYSTPLAFDLVMRMVLNKTDVSELLTHPMFWDFYAAARFIMRLPWVDADERSAASGSSTCFQFCASCAVPWTSAVTGEEWGLIGASSPLEFKDSVADCLTAIRMTLSRHKSTGCAFCNSGPAETDDAGQEVQHSQVTAFVTRILARFPVVAIRAWDSGRLAAGTSASSMDISTFKRSHLAWMSYPFVPLPSHGFVREYYWGIGKLLGEMDIGADSMCFPTCVDESEEILKSIERGPPVVSPRIAPAGPDSSTINSMVNAFSTMVRTEMVPPGVPKQFVYSLIEAANGVTPPPLVQPSPVSSPAAGGVYYSTLPPALHLPSGATTTASNSPAFMTMGISCLNVTTSCMSPKNTLSPNRRNRRMSSCDGWEYAVACPPSMMDMKRQTTNLAHLEGDEDESPPPGFQTVWQSMADDGL